MVWAPLSANALDVNWLGGEGFNSYWDNTNWDGHTPQGGTYDGEVCDDNGQNCIKQYTPGDNVWVSVESVIEVTDATTTNYLGTVAIGGQATLQQNGGTLGMLQLFVGRTSDSGAYFIAGGTTNAGFVGDTEDTGMIIGADYSMGTVRIMATGMLNVDGNMILGQSGGFGVVEQSGGTVTAGTLVVADGGSFQGQYTLSGGTLQTNELSIAAGGSGRLDQSRGTATVNGAMTIGSQGTAKISGGTLTAGSLDNQGNLAIDKAGLLTVKGDYSQGENGTLTLNLNNYALNANNAFLNILGTASLDGSLRVTWSNLNINALTGSEEFKLMYATNGFDSVFDQLLLPELNPAYHWEHSYDNNVFSLSVVAANTSPVPVPSTLILLGSALTALVGCRRRARVH